jgi:hypothetical protein
VLETAEREFGAVLDIVGVVLDVVLGIAKESLGVTLGTAEDPSEGMLETA